MYWALVRLLAGIILAIKTPKLVRKSTVLVKILHIEKHLRCVWLKHIFSELFCAIILFLLFRLL